ncbi:DUF4382 domain-containing protein [Massilia sp. TSP1-1-2]|uniref:DUF4382 domain-containing protein n=1 Tax=unclassified Massilia TaxID=2609279 RepID=UPI003CEBC66E
MNTTLTRLSLATSTICAAAVLVACGGGGSSTPTPASSAMGSVRASLTDAPACGYDEVNITVNKVRVNQSETASETDGGWTDITLAAPVKVNLLKLTNGLIEPLGTAPLTAGHYSQIRLVLDANTADNMANSVKPTGGTLQNLITPSAVQSGLKLNGSFDVAAGQVADVVIDFDACKSIVTRGNGKYALKPVIKMLPAVLNGISGVIAPAQLTSNVMISAQQAGVVVASTVPDPISGAFLLSRLPAGSYDVVITGAGSAATVIGAVPVSATASVPVSTSTTPITLASSATGSIGGTTKLTPAAELATYVSAKQLFAAGPTVTIKYAGSDLVTGAYAINGLPLNAPQYAVYSTTLPLVFAPATTVLPGIAKYTVSASALGYATLPFATAVDIAVANASNVNFALVP